MLCVYVFLFDVAYTTFFLLGLVMSMQVPFVGFQPLRTSEHMAAAGIVQLDACIASSKIVINTELGAFQDHLIVVAMSNRSQTHLRCTL